ncbi:hypothetical protein EDI_251590 [Entamoeba dispar SAW760]|uniref:Uncharacterized protein n=1 Tax=Entamoeba dispar (strain ATCC PRA-260 / SAW760) TaxID=370354 RepID=B0E6Y1_ENTDS|nr:uncharacterized protein EDI_251590 [Entamoeba dispar SAW760]EDR29722.1 hypothetical protein EDI_251590 [Entamoeba dispar SAW760]|eukprot:EDR29722.1 hypothetical protein EDI_251590 [Entamoeba dispar SAW760]
MTKVVIIDNLKTVQESSLNTILTYCGVILSIQKFETQQFNYFIVEMRSEEETSNIMYLTNTLVDGSQIKVEQYDSFREANSFLFKPINSNEQKIIKPNQPISEDKSQPQLSKKEQMSIKAKELGITVEELANKFQSLMVDVVCEGTNSINKLLGKEQYPNYQIPENYVLPAHSTEFKPKTFIIQQNSNSSISNNQKPLPPLPVKKQEIKPENNNVNQTTEIL